MGTQEGVRPLIDRYGRYAQRVQFSQRRQRDNTPSRIAPGTYYYPFNMSFDRLGLERAAAMALREPARMAFGSKSHPTESTPVHSIH
jgi:hypothetical protein